MKMIKKVAFHFTVFRITTKIIIKFVLLGASLMAINGYSQTSNHNDCYLIEEKEDILSSLFKDTLSSSEEIDSLAQEYLRLLLLCHIASNKSFLLDLSRHAVDVQAKKKALQVILDFHEGSREHVLAHYEMASLVATDRINPGNSIDWLKLGISVADSLNLVPEKYKGVNQLINKYIELAENAVDSTFELRYCEQARALCLDALEYYPNESEKYFGILNSYASTYFNAADIPIIDSVFQILFNRDSSSFRTLVNWGTKLNNLNHHHLALDKFIGAVQLIDTSNKGHRILYNKLINCYLALDSLEPAFEVSNDLLEKELVIDFNELDDHQDLPDLDFNQLKNLNHQNLWDLLIVRGELYFKAFDLTGGYKYVEYLEKVEKVFQASYFETVRYESTVESLIAKQQYANRFFNQAFLDLSVQIRDIENVFKYAEIKKSMTALLLRNHFKWRQSLSQDSKDFVESIQDSIRVIQTKTTTQGTTADNLFLKQRLDSLFASYQKVIPNQDVKNIGDIQRRLHRNQHLIEYLYTTDSVYALKISKNRSELVPLGSITETNELIQKVSVAMINRKSGNDLLEPLENAYDYLIKPLQPLAKKLIVVPDQQVTAISFASLLIPGDKPVSERFLINDYHVQYNYSSTFWDEMLEQEARPISVLALAPDFNKVEKNLSLKFNQQEIDVLSAEFSGTYLLAGEATPDRFLDEYNKHSIVHIATHVKIDPIDYLKTSIYLLSADGNDLDSVTLQDIYQRPSFNNLVYLSACESAIGRTLSGEGMVSMANGFAAGGAKSIISTLWNTNDQTAFQITESFYKSAVKGKNKDYALRKAQLDYLRNTNAQGAHPYYWSGIIAIGDMSSLASNSWIKPIHLMVGGVIILLIGWIFRRRLFVQDT